jgi:hypothetical protein
VLGLSIKMSCFFFGDLVSMGDVKGAGSRIREPRCVISPLFRVLSGAAAVRFRLGPVCFFDGGGCILCWFARCFGGA